MRFGIMDLLLDAAGDGTGGGASGDQGTQGGQQGSQQGSQQQGTQGTQGTQAAQPPANQGASGKPFGYDEDRSRWIPPHRLNEESTKRQQLETQLREAQDRIRALAGVQPNDPNGDKQKQIREALLGLPGFERVKKLLDLSEEDFDSLMQAPQTVRQTSQMTAQQWSRHSDQQVDAMATQIAEKLGTDTLDDDQQADLRASFSQWLKVKVNAELQQLGTNDTGLSATLQRYEAGDPKLLTEFVTRYTKNWVQPAGRRAAASNATRTRAVPNSAGRSQQTSTLKRPDKFNSLDERLDYAIASLKDQGMQFGGR